MFVAPRKEAFRSLEKTKEMPPPLKGMHTASRVNATPAGYALRIDNMVCRTDGIHTRDGHLTLATLGSPVTALMERDGHVFAATSTQIVDIDNDISLVPGLSMHGGDWHSVLISNRGGLFLVATNGGDGIRVYDGTYWQFAAIEGVDPGEIVTLCWHQSRLWLVPRSGLVVYYLPLDSFAGTVKPVYLNNLCRKGGSVAAIASMTKEGGRNSNDQLAIITTEGELILWDGVDPTRSETWTMSGVYTLPPPAGRRCFADWGARNAVLTTGGLLPLPDVTPKPDQEKTITALSADIWPTLNPLLASGAWSMASSIDQKLFVLNGPNGQFVRSDTGAWSTFSLNATCWLDTPSGLYFGTSDGRVCRYGGATDDGQPISAYLVDRYDRLGAMSFKTAKEVRPIYLGDHPYKPRVEMLANYREPPSTFAAHWTDGSDPAAWMPPGDLVRGVSNRQGPWRSVAGEGTALALALGMKTTTPIIYGGYDLNYELGASS